MATYLFPPIAQTDPIHQMAHGFMCFLVGMGAAHVEEARSQRAWITEDLDYWIDLERRSEEERDENEEPSELPLDDISEDDYPAILDLIYEALGDRPSKDLWLYDYADEDRLAFEAQMMQDIEDRILAGNTRHIKPHAIEAGIARLKAKGLL